MPSNTRMTHGSAAAGRAVVFSFRRAGLNLAITAMVAPHFFAPMRESKLMRQRMWFLLALVLSACSRSPAPPSGLFPDTVAKVWHRTAIESPSISSSPDPVPRTAVEWYQVAIYEGPGKIEARVYGLSSEGVGIDLSQRWRPSADTVFFYHGREFVVLKWDRADRQALEAFVRNMQLRLEALRRS